MTLPGEVVEVVPGVHRIADTCHVYVVAAPAGPGGERTGIAVDFGSGLVLDLLGELGIDRLTDVLITHHHRDQAQGLARAVAAGVAVHVPPQERELFDRVDEMWAGRPLHNDYDLRDDRFSLLEPVEIDGVVPEYRTAAFGGVEVRTVPTPGHTTGSVSYLVDTACGRVAFTGDLIYAPGKVWSLAATQWSYTENEGPAMVVLSSGLLGREHPDVLCPSHGEPMRDPADALDRLAEAMQRYVDFRRPRPWDLRGLLDNPFVQLSPHLLMNRGSASYGYVLLSDSGAAMFFDFGYDMSTGQPPANSSRAARRPWLASLPALRRHYGVTDIEVAMPTHYHDDHVAGMPLLRDVEGTRIWTPAHIAPVLATPLHHDLPCQWFDPIVSDRVLGPGETVGWREYAITVHDLPGHTLFAAAYEFEVDGHRVLVTGDQQDGQGIPGERQEILNFQYKNRFAIDDYRQSAALYRRLRPDLMVSGHWKPRWVDDDYLRMLARQGERLAELHHELLPLDRLDLGADGVLCRLTPYHSRVPAGGELVVTATVRNPWPDKAVAEIEPVLPPGWEREPGAITVRLPAQGAEQVHIRLRAGAVPCRRARLAVDLTIGDLRLGQHAEALVDVVEIAGTTHADPAPRADRMADQLADHLAAARAMTALLPAIETVGELLITSFAAGGVLYTMGNGGSAADAQHFTGELVGHYRRDRRPLPAVTLSTDATVMTCIANDYAYADVFTRQVRALARPGDVVAAFTTSGESPNVVRALREARTARAVTVLFGGGTGGAAAAHADHLLLAPTCATPRVQEMHTLMLHLISEKLDAWAAG